MMNKMFDREEMMKLTREGMEQSIRFYMTINETLLKIGEQQREVLSETVRKNLDLMNKSGEEYQKNTRIILSRMETMWHEAMDQATPKAKHAE